MLRISLRAQDKGAPWDHTRRQRPPLSAEGDERVTERRSHPPRSGAPEDRELVFEVAQARGVPALELGNLAPQRLGMGGALMQQRLAIPLPGALGRREPESLKRRVVRPAPGFPPRDRQLGTECAFLIRSIACQPVDVVPVLL